MYSPILPIRPGSDNSIYLYENFYLGVSNLVHIHKTGTYMKHWVLWLILKAATVRVVFRHNMFIRLYLYHVFGPIAFFIGKYLIKIKRTKYLDSRFSFFILSNIEQT